MRSRKTKVENPAKYLMKHSPLKNGLKVKDEYASTTANSFQSNCFGFYTASLRV